MEQKIEQLVQELLLVNEEISEQKARTLIELIWSDFEASSAKAGYEYKGQAVTEKVIRQWITSYGNRIHEFVATNPKYAHLLNE